MKDFKKIPGFYPELVYSEFVESVEVGQMRQYKKRQSTFDPALQDFSNPFFNFSLQIFINV